VRVSAYMLDFYGVHIVGLCIAT